jgi:ribosomal protein L11 methyltransferase
MVTPAGLPSGRPACHERAALVPESMTKTAKYLLTEARANALAAATDLDERLSALPAATSDVPEGWQFTLYLSGEDDEGEIAALARLAATILGPDIAAPVVETVPDTDWVAKSLEGLPPVRAARFIVYGGHDRLKRHANEIGIEIEAGEAFGTGHHGTTAGCLIAIDRVLRSRPIRSALDVGTGSGVLAIAIAKAAKARVVASDIDPVATRVARENARLNGVTTYVTVVTAGDLKGALFRSAGAFDLIVANILAGPLIALAPSISRHLAPGGTLILSGLIPEQRARILAAYRGLGLRLMWSSVLNDWLTLTFRR